MKDSPNPSRHPKPPRDFVTTNWTLVHQAASSDPATEGAALESLCNAYWYPIYAYIRGRGRSEVDAEDLTQSFFARQIRLKAFKRADPSRGRLRSYLLDALKKFLISEHTKATAGKRGGKEVVSSFDAAWAESTFASEPVDDLTPDRLYDRCWALTLLDFAFELLREEYAADGQAGLYDLLQPMLGLRAERECSYAELALSSGIGEGALRLKVFRLRRRWKEILCKQVALTLGQATEQNIKEELLALLDCV